MFTSFSRNLLRQISRRTISKSTNRVLQCRRNYFSFSLIDKKFPNLKRLPCNYSTIEVQVEEPVKLDKRQFRRTISEYYRSVIENNKDYHRFVFCLETVKDETKNSENKALLASRELLKDFENNISSVSEEKLVTLKSLLHEEGKLTLYELAEVIHNVATCMVEDNKNGKIFHDQLSKITTLLDEECLNQFLNFSINQKIFLADLWCRYHKLAFSVHNSKFVHKVKWKLFFWMKNLSKTQVVMFFYLLSITKNAPKTTNDFPTYVLINQWFPSFTIEEMGLICYAFGRMEKYPITTDGVNCIVKKLTENIHSCSFKSLKFISKTLSKTLPPKDTHLQTYLYSLQKTVADTSDKFPLTNLLDILFITVHIFSADESLLKATFKRAKENFEEVSCKHLMRFFDLANTLNIHDEEFLQLASEKLKSEKNIGSLGCLKILRWLIIFHVYLDEVLTEILNKEIYDELEGLQRLLIQDNLCFLEMSMTIERPHVEFSKFPEKERQKLLMRNWYKQTENIKYQIGPAGYHLEECLTRIYGTNKCHVFTSVVPHLYTNSTILKLDKNLKGQEIPESWRGGIVLNEIIKPLDKDHYWIVLYLLKRFFFAKDGNLNAEGACIKRQIQALGFIPLPIYTADFVYLESELEKDQFIENRIKEAIQKTIENK